MPEQPDKSQQKTNKDKAPKDVEIDGFTAKELGEESAYNDSTEIAQQMRRGDETKSDPNDRDVGATNAANDDRKAVPRHQRGADDQADKSFDTKEN